MVLQEFLDNFMSNRQRLKEVQNEIRINNIATQRTKSANERELEKFYEDERQRMIKLKLAQIRKQQNTELMTGNVFSDNPNLFSGHKSVLNNDNSIMSRGFL